MTYLLDTNVLVRFFVKDNQSQYLQAVKWFKQAEAGAIQIKVEPLVIAESTFVLESFYKVKREKIVEALTIFLSQEWLKVSEREALLSLWQYYLQGFHLVDSYLLALAHQSESTQVFSFDQDLLKADLK